jgi:hypothetical protein
MKPVWFNTVRVLQCPSQTKAGYVDKFEAVRINTARYYYDPPVSQSCDHAHNTYEEAAECSKKFWKGKR